MEKVWIKKQRVNLFNRKDDYFFNIFDGAYCDMQADKTLPNKIEVNNIQKDFFLIL